MARGVGAEPLTGLVNDFFPERSATRAHCGKSGKQKKGNETSRDSCGHLSSALPHGSIPAADFLSSQHPLEEATREIILFARLFNLSEF